MDFLLDTNIISALLREDARVLAWLASLGPEDRLFTCSIVRGEILFGIQRLPEGQRRSSLSERASHILTAFDCEPVVPPAADTYAQLKAEQQRKGLSLDENDLWIAAVAQARGATLVTRDADFGRVEGRKLLFV